MRLLRRYLLRQLAVPFLYGLGALTSMLLMNQIAKRIGELVGKGLSWWVITEVFVLSLPFIIALTMPMAVLVAVLYAFTTLGGENEITAMRANGIGITQILRPVVLAGLVISVIAFGFIDQVLPRTNARLRNILYEIQRKKPTFSLYEQRLNPIPPSSYYLRAARIDAGTGRMREVTIYDLQSATRRRIIAADSASMAFSANQKDLTLRLFHGRAFEYDADSTAAARMTAFTEQRVIVRDVENLFEPGRGTLLRGDREMSTCEMLDQVQVSRHAARQARREQRDLTHRDLRALLRVVDAIGPAPTVREAPPKACGRWRDIEAWWARQLLPANVEAQQRPVPRLDAAPTPGEVERAAVPILASITEITSTEDRYRLENRRADSYAVEIHKKFSISLACLNFVFIAFALALRFPRGGMGLVLGAALVVFAIFYAGLSAGESLADRDTIAPWVGMWAPHVIFGVLGVWGLLRVNRESGSTRGGDLADLVETVRGWLPARRHAS